ncbi:hypothetical protein BWI17_14625 [Betaproteobacteria bacterium GR16-43]|nr:hypothetical protein BWI17_14625 [Betaproteobacteria bacterium GR16-43]
MVLASANALAAPGDLDPSFNGNGRVTFPYGQAQGTVIAVRLQGDGKIVAVGTVGSEPVLTKLTRYMPDGSLDTTFGNAGRVAVPFGGTPSWNMDLALQGDGKILVLGTTISGGQYRGTVARFNGDGSVDGGYGSSGVAAVLPTAGVQALAVQGDGKAIIVGRDSDNAFFARLNLDGTPDPSFGVGGLARLFPETVAYAVAIQADGRIVAAGDDEDRQRVAILRLNADGSPDTSFGTGGKASSDLDFLGVYKARAVVLATDGKITVSAFSNSGPSLEGLRVARFETSGQLDASFGERGVATVPHNNYTESHGIAVSADGKIVVTAFASRGSLVARLNSNGSLDASFSSGGVRIINNGVSGSRNVVVDPLDRIVSAGWTALTRLLPDGTSDEAFGAHGTASFPLGERSTYASFRDVVIGGDGRIVAGGGTFSDGFFVARFLADGTKDASFGVAGIVDSPLDGPTGAVALLPDGKILVGGRPYYDFLNQGRSLARLNANGTIDMTFGSGGIAPGPGRIGVSRILTLSGGRFLAFDGEYIGCYQANGTLDATYGSGGVVNLASGQTMVQSLQADEKLLVAGVGLSLNPPRTLALRRLGTTGSFDTSFGTLGGVSLAVSEGTFAFGVEQYGDGRILLAAGGPNETYFIRYMANGTPDTSFGNGGLVRSAPLFLSARLVLEPDGRIVLGGLTSSGYAMARYRPDGQPDATYGTAGVAYVAAYAVDTYSQPALVALARQADGRHLLAGGDIRFGGLMLRFLGGSDGILPVATDFDGEGHSDILWHHGDGRQAIWLMSGTTPTQSREIIAAGTGWSATHVADFDGDGKDDIVWQHTDGRVAIYLMLGTVPASTQQILNAGNWTVTHVADLDGDGKADLLFRNTDGSVAKWTMSGTTMTSGATILGAGTGWSIARTADFNGDGRQDLVWKHTDGRHAIWISPDPNAPGLPAQQQILDAGGWTITHTPDTNGDGRSDLVLQHADGRIALWMMNGVTPTQQPTLLGAGSGWRVTHTGDFNNDGRDDLVFQHTDGSVALWLMNGPGPSETAIVLGPGTGWSVKRLADLNGDGKSDIVWEHTDGRVAVWLMNGTSMMSGQEILGPGTGWSVSGVSP